jgi:hypothetical protein
MGVIKHGKTKSKTYKSWRSMKERCLNKNNPSYKTYGGKGITICKEWMNFENFLKDMKERPEEMTLDRINPEGNYERNNCRWATKSQQRRNCRGNSNSLSKFKGVTWHKKMQKWYARIKKLKKDVHLGYYDNEIDAAKAYNNAAKLYYGDDIRINEIENVDY